MTTGYYIMDSSVKRMNARNVLEEGLWYADNGQWVSSQSFAYVYAKVEDAVTEAKKLQVECPVKVLHLQVNGPNVGVGEIKF